MPTRRSAALSLVGFCLVLAGFVGLSVRTARASSLIHDEVYTHYLSRFGSVGELWDNLAAGTDLNPPMNYLLVRAGTEVFGDSPAGLRAAPIACYTLAVGLVFLHLRRRSETAGWLGGLFLLACNLPYYAGIARAYSALVCVGAIVLVLRSLAHHPRPAARWAAAGGLGLALAAGAYTHYFAVLLYLPVAAGELAAWWAARRIRPTPTIWAALVLGGLLTIPLLPLVQTARGFRAAFWAKPDFGSLELAYAVMFVNAVVPLVLLAGLCVWAGRPRDDATAVEHDRGAELGFLAIPAAAVFLGIFVTQAFDKRYAVPGYLGVACAIAALATPYLIGRRVLTGFALLGLAAWWLAGSELRYRKAVKEEEEWQTTIRRIEQELAAGRTVVVYDQLMFTPLAHSIPGHRDRLVYLSVPAESPADYNAANDDRNLSNLDRVSGGLGVVRLDRWTPPADGFVAVGTNGWQADALAARGFRPTRQFTDLHKILR